MEKLSVMSSNSGLSHFTGSSGDVEVLVCVAVRKESRCFTLPPSPSTDLLVTGIGLRKTSAAITGYLDAKRPQLVLTCGFAGGLSPALKVGDVLFDCQHASQFNAALNGSGAVQGRFAHSDRVLASAVEKLSLFQETGADAVEMESSAAIAACKRRSIPVVVLRVISDSASDDLPMDFNRYTNPDGSLSMPRLLAGIALSPSTIPKLMTFNGQLELAAERLGATLGRFLSLRDLL